MSNGIEKGKKGSENQKSKKQHPFLRGSLFGLFFGILMGWALGWWFRPPSSFPIEELKQATEVKFSNTTDNVREQLAEFAEQLARKLRREKNNL